MEKALFSKKEGNPTNSLEQSRAFFKEDLSRKRMRASYLSEAIDHDLLIMKEIKDDQLKSKFLNMTERMKEEYQSLMKEIELRERVLEEE